MPNDLRVLFRKEIAQLLRSRAALWTSITIPFFLLVVAPLSEFLSITEQRSVWMERFAMNMPVPGLRDALMSPLSAVKWVFPLLVSLGGLLVPAITAVHTVISERDNRTLELLAALPVKLSHILLAKLGTILIFCAIVSAVLLTIDALVLVPRGLVSVGYMLSAYALAVCSMAYSATASLLTTLLAKDFRTANNINGMLLAPMILIATIVLSLVPGESARTLALAATFLAIGALALLVAVRIVSFERLLK